MEFAGGGARTLSGAFFFSYFSIDCFVFEKFKVARNFAASIEQSVDASDI